MDMEKLASDWVDQCKFEHPKAKLHPEYSGLGQNLAITGGSSRNVTQMVANWFKEVGDYDYDTNTCKERKQCGHYTQVSRRINTIRISDKIRICTL